MHAKWHLHIQCGTKYSPALFLIPPEVERFSSVSGGIKGAEMSFVVLLVQQVYE